MSVKLFRQTSLDCHLTRPDCLHYSSSVYFAPIPFRPMIISPSTRQEISSFVLVTLCPELGQYLPHVQTITAEEITLSRQQGHRCCFYTLCFKTPLRVSSLVVQSVKACWVSIASWKCFCLGPQWLDVDVRPLVMPVQGCLCFTTS